VQRGALYLGFSHKTRIGLEVLQVELERLIMGHLLLKGKKKKTKRNSNQEMKYSWSLRTEITSWHENDPSWK
jgi:hypothetical protein